jgi:NodT family efflux transporter outer membrane factor (OMF) lipoprotein
LNWWNKYNDSILTDYLTTAYKNNQDLKIATINVKQSEQLVKQSFANQLPYLGFQGDVSRTFTASDVRFGEVLISDYSQSNFTLPITMSYEVDIWGENYLKTKAVKKQLEIAKENERSSYIALTTAVASDYFNLLRFDKIIKNQTELVELQTEIVRMAEIKYQNGLCPVTTLLEEKQMLNELKKALNSYINKRIVVARELGVLTGEREKEVMERGDLSNIALISLPDSISSEAIKYRPDMIKCEDYIQKIGIDVRVARRDFLPKFLIYGNVGFNAYKLGNIFGNHTFLSNAGVLPSLDLFTGGAKIARLKYSKLEYEKAQQMYEKTILTSIQEINNSMSDANKSNENYQESMKKYGLEKEKFTLSQRKYDIGAKSKMDNMRAKELLLLAEMDEFSDKTDYLISTLSIYKAVGGKDFTTINEGL